MKKFLITLAVLLMVFAAFVARENSTGKRLIDTGRSYTEHLAAGERVEAYSLLSDSLKTLLTPHILDFLEWPSAEGRIRTGRNEVRGFAISISISEGGSRTLWLREASGGGAGKYRETRLWITCLETLPSYVPPSPGKQ